MEQYEPERLSAAQLAAMRRSLTNGKGALTRRSLLRASGMGALAIGGLGTLSACGIPPAKREGDAAAASDDHSAKEKQVNFSNWTEYMDVSEDEKHRPTLEAFTERTGIKVKYTEDINDNVEFFGKIKPQLAAYQDTGRDLIIVTDWLAARIIRLGWAQKLDQANLPHAFANLSPQFRTPDWDPGRAYSYPWTGIPTVIAYNSKATGGRKVDSVTQLLDDPTLKGRVAFLSEMRDSVGMTLLDMGKDPGKFTDADYDAAIGRMQKGVDRNQIRRFTGNDYTADLDKGDIAACVAWAGDIIQLQVATRTSSSPSRPPDTSPPATTCWSRPRPGTRRTPRSSWTTTTSPRSPPSSPRTSTTSARSTGSARNSPGSTRRWPPTR